MIVGACVYPAPGLIKLIELSLPSLETLAIPIAVIPAPTDPTISMVGEVGYPFPSLSI